MKKDVELLIKAKENASKLLEGVTEAVHDFVASQDDAQKATNTLGSTFDRVSKIVADFSKSWQGATPGDRIARDMERAAKTTARYEGDVVSLSKKLDDQTASVEKTKASINNLQSEIAKLTKAQEAEVSALAKARAERASVNSELGKATTAVKTLTDAQARLNSQIDKQQEKVSASSARYADLQKQVAAAEAPTKRLVEQTEAAGRAFQKNQERLDGLKSRLSANTDELRRAQENQKIYSAFVDEASQAVEKQKAALQNARTELQARNQALRDAIREEKRLGAAAKATEDDFFEAAKSLDSSKESMAALAVLAKESGQSMDQLAAAMRGGLVDAIRLQQSNLDRISKSYKEVSAAQAQLSQVISAAGVPTRQMAEQQQKLAASSKEIATLHYQQKQALTAMRAELSATAADSSRLTNAQKQFAATIQQSAASLAQAQGISARVVAGNQQIAAAAATAGRATRDLGQAQRNQGSDADKASRSNGGLAEAYRKIYGESRQAMSWTQRLRGEVLSLVTSYAGVYAAVDVLGRVVDATRTLEQAQVRLKSVFGTDLAAGQELDFLRRTANDLALDLGVLTAEYSKFAAATKNTALEGADTRNVFVSVSKAARVLSLSTEEVEGVMKALTQIASKGKIQLEELTGQLGDRLPGALQIMADGLGITTQELLDMTKNGEVTADQLAKFGEELERRYGKFVPDAMKSTAAAIQGFSNAAFQALNKFGEGGFMDGFRSTLESITKTLQSAKFEDFASKLSAVFGVLAKAVGVAVENFDLLIIAATAMTSIRLIPAIADIARGFGNWASGAKAAQAATTAAGAAASAGATQVGLLATAATRASVALRALLSSTGVGILVAAVATGISIWATRTNEATAAMNEHERIVDAVKNGYDEAGGKVDEWAGKIKEVTRLQLENSRTQLAEAARVSREANKVGNPSGFRRNAGMGIAATAPEILKVADALRELEKEWIQNGGDVDAYKKKISDMVDTVGVAADSALGKYALALQDAADASRKTETAVKQNEAAIRANNGTATEADATILGLGQTVNKTGEAFGGGASSVGKFGEALDKLKSMIPGLANELKKLDDLKSIDEAYDEAVKNASSMLDILDAVGLKNRARRAVFSADTIKAVENASDGVDAAKILLRKFEGFEVIPKKDVNALRGGYGTDTFTAPDGRVSAVTAQTRFTREDAERDLVRRLNDEFFPKIINQIGSNSFGAMNPAQQGVLGTIAYNYGSLPKTLVDAIKTGNKDTITEAIRALGEHNDGIRRDRYNQAADVFSDGQLDEKATALAEKKAEAQLKFNEGHKEYLAGLDREIAGQTQGLILREQEKAIAEREKAAKEAGRTLSEQEKNDIRERIALKYQEEAAEEAIKAKKDAAKEAEERVNQLISQRRDLEQQIAIYREQGDTTALGAAEQELTNINTQLQAAIDNAIKMWQAVKGPESEAAISALKTARLEAKYFGDAGKKSLFDWQQVGQLFANGLVRAFDSFAQKVAEGKSVGEAAKEAFMEFAGQFLIDIGRMIVQQIVFNAVSGLMKSFGLPGLQGFGGVSAGTLHSGGLAGSAKRTRSVSSAMFANAPRYHVGGLAGRPPGLAPDEVPAILRREEEVLTRDDPRHILNGGGMAAAAGAGEPMKLNIINTIDPSDMLSKAAASEPGAKVLLNFIRQNRDEVNGALS